MEHISNFLEKLVNSPLLYIFSVFVIIYCLRKGIFSVNTGAVQLGRTKGREREILSKQISYINLHMGTIAVQLCKQFPEVNKYHIKYVVELLIDELVKRVTLNHISLDEIYVEDTTLTLVQISRKRSEKDYFWSEEFEAFTREEVKKILTQLLNIRKKLDK